MDLATMAAPLYFETIVVPAHLLAIGLFTAPFILLVVKQRNSARSSLLTLFGVAFAGIGFYISLVAIVRTFGATLLWGVAFVIVGFATIALTQLRRAKDQGLVEYLNLGNGVRKWLFQDTLLASLQEDQIVKTLTDLGRSYGPFLIIGKQNKNLTQRALTLVPENVKHRLTRPGMLHLLPASLQQILIGERAAKQNTELSPKDAAEHSGSQDRTQTQESPSVSDDSSSNAHTAASAANVGGLPSRSATTKEGTPNDPARGGSSADADVLQFVLQEKWKEASKPLASSALGKVQKVLIAAVALQLFLSPSLRTKLRQFIVRFGFVATVLGLAGSFVVARIIDAGHGTRHALSLDDVPDLFAKVSQVGSRVSGTTRMGLTMLAMYVIRKLMNK